MHGSERRRISEISQLATIWYDGWQDAHARILPVELADLRTLESFEDRLRVALAGVRVVGPAAAPLGFCMLRGAELYQLYVSSQARGTGVAAALLSTRKLTLATAASTRPGLHAPLETTAPRGSREVRLASHRHRLNTLK